MARKIPLLPGLALTGLLKAHGWTAKELAAKAGVSQSAMSAYESGDVTRERLDELAALMGLGPEEVEQALFAASLLLPPPLLPRRRSIPRRRSGASSGAPRPWPAGTSPAGSGTTSCARCVRRERPSP